MEDTAGGRDTDRRGRIDLRRVAAAGGAAAHQVLPVNLRLWGGSALTSDEYAVPENREGRAGEIPITYVPARNLIFLALATGYAEALGARDIFIGVNSVDYSGYPDCRPAFIRAFAEAARLGTRAVDENWHFEIHAPLQNWSKAEIIRRGTALGVDYSLTVSCYQADEAGARLRGVRQLPPAARGFSRRRGARPHAVPLTAHAKRGWGEQARDFAPSAPSP